MSDWGQRDCAVIGIGYFDQEEDQLSPVSIEGRYRSGIGVETMLLGDFIGGSDFCSFLFESEDGEEEGLANLPHPCLLNIRIRVPVRASTRSGNYLRNSF